MFVNPKRFESLVHMLYASDSSLPPLWQVIYQEGVRSNHLLFEHEDVDRFMAEDFDATKNLSQGETETVCKAAFDVLRSADLTGMKHAISRLTLNQRRTCFYLYLHALRFWRDHLKATLN